MRRTEYVVCLGVKDGAVLGFHKCDGPRDAYGWNGPGGKIERGETPEAAADREWREEVRGAEVSGPWVEVGRTVGTGWRVYWMAAPIESVDVMLTVCGLPATLAYPALISERGASKGFVAMARKGVAEFGGYR